MDDAPTPASFSKNEMIKSSSEFKLKYNNQEYSSKLTLSDTITINLEELGFGSLVYYINLNLEEFPNLNKIFKQYDTLEECYDCLIKFFEKNKVNIDKIGDDISIKIQINSLFGETEEVKIPLMKNPLEKSNDRQLYQEITELKNKIIYLENETKDLKKIINALQKENKEYKEKIESRLTKMELEIPKYNNNIYYNIDSKIISPNEDIAFLIKRLQKYLKSNSITFKLIYRASVNGDEPSDFHNKCDNIKNVLVLYYTTKFIKFGGFTSIGFDSSNCSKDDLNCFIFNINDKKIYEPEEKNQVGCFEVNGPFFGRFNSAIYMYDGVNFLTKKENQHKTNKNIVSFQGLKNNKFVINNGDEFFSLIELEVFKIK